MRLTPREISGVFRIRTSAGIGTAFLYHSKSGCCFLSARHLLENTLSGDNVEIQHSGGWTRIGVTQIEFSKMGYDICSFTSGQFRINKLLDTYPGLGAHLGCEMLFLGFPHDLINDYPGQGYPSPFVKGGNFQWSYKY